LSDGSNALGGMKQVRKKGEIVMRLKRRIQESKVVPKVMYSCETWNMNAKDKNRGKVFKMKGLRGLWAVEKG